MGGNTSVGSASWFLFLDITKLSKVKGQKNKGVIKEMQMSKFENQLKRTFLFESRPVYEVKRVRITSNVSFLLCVPLRELTRH